MKEEQTIQPEFNFRVKVEPANNQLASVLKMLIEQESVSERQTNYNGFRARISNLRLNHGMDIRYKEANFTNEFGNPGTYRKHYLVDKEKAVDVYRKINK